jgi:succinate dehydrogenase hydrophobic anchor subunit
MKKEKMTMSQSTPTSTAGKSPSGAGIFVGLIPWFLFTIIAEHGTLKLASIASVVIAVGVCLYSMRGGERPKMIELAAVATFIVFTVIAFVADPSITHWLTRYARAVAAAVLALLVFGSLLFVPFTEEYARESVPRQYWDSPQFKAINRRLTAMWGAVFAVMTVSHVIAGTIDKRPTNIIFNWAIPIALVLWGVKNSKPADDDATPSVQQQA